MKHSPSSSGRQDSEKTLSLRMIIDALDPRKYKIALITNPGLSYSQLLKEIIGQITGTTCAENRKVNLLEIFNHLLLEAISQGARIVILIDEASTLSGRKSRKFKAVNKHAGRPE